MTANTEIKTLDQRIKSGAWLMKGETGNILAASMQEAAELRTALAATNARIADLTTVAPRAAPGANPIAYAVYGIGNGAHYLKGVYLICEDWKSEDHCLGDYWAGNEVLYTAAQQPESDPQPTYAEWRKTVSLVQSIITTVRSGPAIEIAMKCLDSLDAWSDQVSEQQSDSERDAAIGQMAAKLAVLAGLLEAGAVPSYSDADLVKEAAHIIAAQQGEQAPAKKVSIEHMGYYLVQFKARPTSPSGSPMKPCGAAIQGQYAVLRAVTYDDGGRYPGEWQFNRHDMKPIAVGENDNDCIRWIAEGDLNILGPVPDEYVCKGDTE